MIESVEYPYFFKLILKGPWKVVVYTIWNSGCPESSFWISSATFSKKILSYTPTQVFGASDPQNSVAERAESNPHAGAN